jgi:CBS domain-containing protein
MPAVPVHVDASLADAVAEMQRRAVAADARRARLVSAGDEHDASHASGQLVGMTSVVAVLLDLDEADAARLLLFGRSSTAPPLPGFEFPPC